MFFSIIDNFCHCKNKLQKKQEKNTTNDVLDKYLITKSFEID